MSEKEDKDIVLPNWRDGVLETDSILKNKLKTSKNFGLTYIFLCERLQKNKPKVRAFELGSALKMSNSYAYQILDEFVKLGYLNKRSIKSGKGGTTIFFPAVYSNLFIRESFIKEAKKWCDI